MSKKFRRAHREMWRYLKKFPDATAEEIHDLREWVKDGHSPYENGDFVADEHGGPLDFINTMRFWADMLKQYEEDPVGFEEAYIHPPYLDMDPADYDVDDDDDELPF